MYCTGGTECLSRTPGSDLVYVLFWSKGDMYRKKKKKTLVTCAVRVTVLLPPP